MPSTHTLRRSTWTILTMLGAAIGCMLVVDFAPAQSDSRSSSEPSRSNSGGSSGAESRSNSGGESRSNSGGNSGADSRSFNSGGNSGDSSGGSRGGQSISPESREQSRQMEAELNSGSGQSNSGSATPPLGGSGTEEYRRQMELSIPSNSGGNSGGAPTLGSGEMSIPGTTTPGTAPPNGQPPQAGASKPGIGGMISGLLGMSGGSGSASGAADAGLMAALDIDHDGTLSQAEIRASIQSLSRLDANGDGQLTGNELGGAGNGAPPQIAQNPNSGSTQSSEEAMMQSQAGGTGVAATPGGNADGQSQEVEAFIGKLMAYDRNADGRIRKSELPRNLSRLFFQGDKDRNGYIDSEEAVALAELYSNNAGGSTNTGASSNSSDSRSSN